MPSSSRLLLILTQVYGDGGIQRFNRTLLNACQELGLHCDVHALNDHQAPSATPALSVMAYRGNRIWFAMRIFLAACSNRYDTVLIGHVNFLSLLAIALRLRGRRGPRALLVAHGMDVWYGLRGARRRALRALDRILCVSRYTQTTMQREAPEIPADRYVLFPNALNSTWAQAGAAVTAMTDTAGPLPRRFILSVTRLNHDERAKGVCSVLEALPMLDATDVHYVIAGNGDDREFLQRVSARLRIAERVHFLGEVSDRVLRDLYGGCEAFVLPSGQEGFGLVFLEAMYFGAAVIAAGAKGVLDVIEDGETGLLVPFGDVVSLKHALDRLLADSALRERLRSRGRGMVNGDGAFTFRAFVERWGRIYHRPESNTG